MDYEVVIGLEVHAQLKTESKIFCGCSTRFGAEPNANTCPVCLGMPGVLPVLNRRVVEFAVMMGLATGCRIAPESVFARKNYFYPDLPKGYQISQYELPLCTGGHLDIKVGGPGDPRSKRIGITRIHVEEDAGKLVHQGASLDAATGSAVDLNRAGVPLIEIVSEPDMRSPEEAREYMQGLRDILVYLDICDGNMEEGSLRCDANVSLMPQGSKQFGTRAEIKNMNSFRFLQQALEYEIERQAEVLEGGGKVVQETRLFDSAQGVTRSMRGKEEAHDYRYFPDPDLVPLRPSPEWVEGLRGRLPELRQAKVARYTAEFGLPEYDAGVLTAERETATFFEQVVAAGAPPKAASNWVMGEASRLLKEAGPGKASPGQLARVIALVEGKAISTTAAKTVFSECWATGADPEKVVEKLGLAQVSDEGALAGAVAEVLAACPAEVAQYKAGKVKIVGFLVGQVMKRMGGRANPQVVNKLLEEALR